MNTVSISTGPEQQVWAVKDLPGVVGIRRDGSKCTAGGYANTPGICFNYRGPMHQKWIQRLVNSSAFAKYRITWLSLDMEVWRPPAWDEICFCERCRKLFREFCLKNHRRDLAELDPRTATGKDFETMWKKFQCESASGFTRAAVDAVRTKVKGAPSTSPWGDFTSQDYGIPGANYAPDSLNIFECSVYFTPDGNYQKLLQLSKRPDIKPNSLGTGLSLGQTGGCPDWHMTAEHAKESIYEVMIFGTRMVVYYYGLYMDPLRMSKIVEALNAVTPFEDIVLDGKLSSAVKASDPKMLLTRRSLGAESLLAVRAYYSPKPVTAEISFPKVTSELNVYDCETGKIVGKLTPDQPSFTYTIGAKRCRLLYAGTAEQWKKRHE